MGLAATTTEAAMSAIQESLAQLSVALGRIAARQDQMLEDLKKTTAALAPIATTTPMLGSGRVLEQQTTKPSSSSLFSAIQVVGAGAPHVDAVFAATMPTRCSTIGSAVNIGSNHAVVLFPTSGMTQLRATTSINVEHKGVGSGASMSAGCSTHVLTCLPDDPGARSLEINMAAEVMTHVGDLSLFSELDVVSADEVFKDSPIKDMAWDDDTGDSVFTYVGGLSLFKEMDLDNYIEFEESVDKAEDATDLIWVTPSMWNMVFGVTTLCGQSALAPANSGLGGAHGLFHNVPPWETNAFHPGNFATKSDHLSLNKIPSWQRSAFSPGYSEIVGAHGVFDPAPPWGTNAFQPRFFSTQVDPLVLEEIPAWDRSDLSLHSVFEKISPWSCDGFYPWKRNALRYGTGKHLNIMDVPNGDLFLETHGAWNYIRAEQIIKLTKLGHFNILRQLAFCWEYLGSTYCLRFNPYKISSLEVLKARIKSCSTIKVATPWSCFLINQMEYMGQALLVFCFSLTCALDRYVQEVAVSSMIAINTVGGNLCVFACQLLNEALKAGHADVMEDPLKTLVAVSCPHTYCSVFCDIESEGLDRKLQYIPWNLSVHYQMIGQVQQRLCKCYYFCSLIHLAKHLQYKQWDPGVMWIVCAEGIKLCSAQPRGMIGFHG